MDGQLMNILMDKFVDHRDAMGGWTIDGQICRWLGDGLDRQLMNILMDKFVDVTKGWVDGQLMNILMELMERNIQGMHIL